MCLAVPGKVIKISGKKASIQSSRGHTHEVDLSLVRGVKTGDYLLVHADMAINKLPQEEAEKILKITNQHGHAH
jgi:hydrogenase expression/formation protein HypC